MIRISSVPASCNACRLALAALLLGLAACAGYDGRGLVPGQSTSAEVDKVMGPAKDRRAAPNGETVLWYPRLPSGRVSYAARIGKDDKLIAIEQRLTRENLKKIQPDVSRESDVRDVLGPPYRIDAFPRMQRDAWVYQAQEIDPLLIVVQLSKDGVVRETYMINDPDTTARDGPE
jgi:hypothetical protein